VLLYWLVVVTMQLILVAICLWMLPGALVGCGHGWRYAYEDADLEKTFWLGLLGAVPLCPLARYVIPDYATLRHELAHAVAALLCFRAVERFEVTASGPSHVEVADDPRLGLSPPFIGLAPYYLTIAAPISILLSTQAPGEWRCWIQLGWGLLLGFHLANVVLEVPVNFRGGALTNGEYCPTDIEQVGYFSSIVLILAFNAILLGGTLHLLGHDPDAFAAWRACVIETSRDFYTPLWHGLQALLDRFEQWAS